MNEYDTGTAGDSNQTTKILRYDDDDDDGEG